jgi:hypothetical protein
MTCEMRHLICERTWPLLFNTYSLLLVWFASLDEGKAVIPVWLDVIYQGLASKLLR